MAPTAATPAWIHINDPAISGQIPARRGSRPPGLRGTGGAGELRALHHGPAGHHRRRLANCQP